MTYYELNLNRPILKFFMFFKLSGYLNPIIILGLHRKEYVFTILLIVMLKTRQPDSNGVTWANPCVSKLNMALSEMESVNQELPNYQ